jgi:hypothetical protein
MGFDAAKVILFFEKCKEMAVNFQLRTENQQSLGFVACLVQKKSPRCITSMTGEGIQISKHDKATMQQYQL